MKKTAGLYHSLLLVWKSAPAWAAINIILSIFRSILPLGLVFLVKHLINSITSAASSGGSESLSPLLWLIIMVAAVFFLDEISLEFSNLVRKKQSLALESYMYDLLHRKSVSLDLVNFENPAYFDTLSRAAREAIWRPGNILNNLVAMFRGLLSVILMAGILLYLSWWIVLLLAVVNIPAIWLRLHFADILYNFRRDQTPEARKAAYFNWLLTGDRPSRELRLFGLGDYFIGRFRDSFNKSREEEIVILRKRAFIDTVSTIVKAAALFIILWYIARRTIGGSLSLGEMAMYILAFRQGMLYIREIFSSLAGLYEDSLFTSDIFEFLNLKSGIYARDPVTAPGLLNSGIKIVNISFTYPGSSEPAVRDLSFDLKKGETVAIVGHNGAGKSTLVRLLCRLYDPDSGEILWDGRNICNMDPAEYRRCFSVVFQDFMLYNLAAGENIRLGDIHSGKSLSDIEKAAEMTGIDGLFRSLPEGYNTTIGNLFDDSRDLSWGEWQKIALARAIFRDASLMILDEPSSALDAAAEFEIFSRLKEIVKGKTVMLISHRFTNVKLADRIMVMDKGRIAETGTHQELMKSGGIYSEMYFKQSSRFTDEK